MKLKDYCFVLLAALVSNFGVSETVDQVQDANGKIAGKAVLQRSTLQSSASAEEESVHHRRRVETTVLYSPFGGDLPEETSEDSTKHSEKQNHKGARVTAKRKRKSSHLISVPIGLNAKGSVIFRKVSKDTYKNFVIKRAANRRAVHFFSKYPNGRINRNGRRVNAKGKKLKKSQILFPDGLDASGHILYKVVPIKDFVKFVRRQRALKRKVIPGIKSRPDGRLDKSGRKLGPDGKLLPASKTLLPIRHKGQILYKVVTVEEYDEYKKVSRSSSTNSVQQEVVEPVPLDDGDNENDGTVNATTPTLK